VTEPVTLPFRFLLKTGEMVDLLARHRVRRLERGRREADVRPVARMLARSRDEKVVRLAQAALEQVWSSGVIVRHVIWHDLRAAADDDPSDAIVDFALAPEPESRYEPRVRLVAAMDELRVGPEVIAWAGHPRVADLLRVTDHPLLLNSLEDVFIEGLLHDPVGLWSRRGILRILVDNPHTGRPARAGAYSSISVSRSELSVLAILKGQLELLDQYPPAELVGTLLSSAARQLPPDVTGACRRVLRELPVGAAREQLCEYAMDGDAEARAAVVDAGFEPAAAKRLALFLFCTRQWERYDRADPRGRRLKRHRSTYSGRDWERLARAAEHTGRRGPKRPAPPQLQWPRLPRMPSSDRYRPGGTGTSGSGGFGNPGSFGGFGI
jgi:hypothetical protein